MKTLLKTEAKLDALRVGNQTFCYKKKLKSSIKIFDIKSYQKIFIVLITLSIFLIFPESPKEMETVCNSYYSDKICNVW